MRRMSLSLLAFVAAASLCSCADTRIADVEGVVWRFGNDFFQLVAEPGQINPYEPCSTITILGAEYNCALCISNGGFLINLYDDSNERIRFYGDAQSFVSGHCTGANLVREKGKAYQYSVDVKLVDECQYCDYCDDHGLDYPESITMYGYPVEG